MFKILREWRELIDSGSFDNLFPLKLSSSNDVSESIHSGKFEILFQLKSSFLREVKFLNVLVLKLHLMA